MEIAVLLKAVPRAEAIRFDPARRAVVRDGPDLVLNPFDQRALRVGLELRRPGERVTVVSLGPPAAGPVLREARALGADRAVLLTDPAFAGSDLLATSTAIAAALRRIGPDLVVAGARSTDSDTGLIGPEVAGQLGVPVVSTARAVRRSDDPRRLEVDVDTPTGGATVAVVPPLVLTVGEKIGKPLRVDPARYAEVGADAVDTVGPADLGLAAAEVGEFGSPTTVVDVRPAVPTRRPVRFETGPAEERVRGAAAALAPLLERPGGEPVPLPWPPAYEPSREVLVLASEATGAIDPSAAGVVTGLRRALPTHSVRAVLYGGRELDAAQEPLAAAGSLGGYRLDPAGLPFDSRDAARGLAALLDHRPRAAAVVLAASPFGREVAGQLAASRGMAAVGDATGVRAASDGRLEWSKPSFGGATFATVRCRPGTVVATVPPGFDRPATDRIATERFPWEVRAAPPPTGSVRRSASWVEDATGPEPEGAEVVVAVGAGIGGPEAIARLGPTVRRWGAALVGTRRVVDAGWLPVRRQVGLTGRALAPRLAVLLGVRGSLHHMVGWSRAGAILAVDRDPAAPVLGQADVGIVGSLEEVVPLLAEPLALRLARGPRG